ncbi:hypothetical protein GCM10017673_14880 [Streptosporangium violaceochromogenes]|nr:hypothetical protein GCM10017673_14880 [Streptosporangium violaceochromogenes]
MRLIDPVSTMVETAITNQANPGETFHYDVTFYLAPRPGGYNPELQVTLVGYTAASVEVMAPPENIAGATTTQTVVDAVVGRAITWIRAQ